MAANSNTARDTTIGLQGDQVDFFIEPEIGFRIWRMGEDDLTLRGTVVDRYVWPHIEDAAAECMPFPNFIEPESIPHKPAVVPVRDCNCGFYGYSTYADLQDHQYWQPLRIVRGVVVGWGKTWTAEHGWRCKFARPVALLAWPERRITVTEPFGRAHMHDRDKWEEVLRHIAVRYNIPVCHSPEELDLIANGYRL